MDTALLTPATVAVQAVAAEMTEALESFHHIDRCIDGEVTDLVLSWAQVLSAAKAGYLKAVAAHDSRGIAEANGDLSTKHWLAGALNLTHRAAKDDVAMAKACSGPHKPVGDALASGGLNPEQTPVIVEALRKLAKVATAEQVDFARDRMLEAAAHVNATDLHELGQWILNRADTDGPEPDERTRPRSVTYTKHADGTQSVHYRDGIEQVAKLKAAIAALERPDDAEDLRSTPQRRADAMRDIIEKTLRAGDLPNSRGVAPHLSLVIGLETLKGLDQATYGALATGSALSPAAVQLLACDSDITPIVLDKNGAPLSVGRTYRTVTAPIWKALVARDGGCVHAGCTAPPWLCRAHHIRWWEHGGITSVENGVLLCEKHHRGVHLHGWEVRLGPDGIPEMIPPKSIDPEQRPRRNTYWKIQRDLLDPHLDPLR